MADGGSIGEKHWRDALDAPPAKKADRPPIKKEGPKRPKMYRCARAGCLEVSAHPKDLCMPVEMLP